MSGYESYTDTRALHDFRNRWDERGRQAEVYLSFRLEGHAWEEANRLAREHFAAGNP